MKSIFVDWTKEYSKATWDFVGRCILEDAKGLWSAENQDGISEDEGYPIYNYAYPLFSNRIKDEIILKVCEQTNCTVVYNQEEDAYYLALTGCGMDMSQDIALAYIIVDGRIDWDFLDSVCISGPLSVGKSNYMRILKEMRRQIEISISNLKTRLSEVKKNLSENKDSMMEVA